MQKIALGLMGLQKQSEQVLDSHDDPKSMLDSPCSRIVYKHSGITHICECFDASGVSLTKQLMSLNGTSNRFWLDEPICARFRYVESTRALSNDVISAVKLER